MEGREATEGQRAREGHQQRDCGGMGTRDSLGTKRGELCQPAVEVLANLPGDMSDAGLLSIPKQEHVSNVLGQLRRHCLLDGQKLGEEHNDKKGHNTRLSQLRKVPKPVTQHTLVAEAASTS